MKIEDGKFYRRRDGEVVGPAQDTKDGSGYPINVPAPDVEGLDYWYTAEGWFWSSQREDPLDLVEEVQHPNAKPALKIEDGKFYRRWDGVVVGPMSGKGDGRPFVAPDPENPDFFFWYAADGRSWGSSIATYLDLVEEVPDPIATDLDLVEEVPDPNAKPDDFDDSVYGGPIPAPEPRQESPRFRVGDRVRDVVMAPNPLATVRAVNGTGVKVQWGDEEFNERLASWWPDTDFELLDGAPAVGAPDLVDHPPHYTAGGIECFDAMAAMLSREEMIGYLRGNSFKYRWRFRHKGGAEDLRKAAWYEDKLLGLVAETEV